ncbi:hypothetical protein O3G_MSEX002222 [Manduca sexta]|uniref:Uncharacterized protein n=1 Tax=Manduca sexta TaxID=7130 RepID=A0A922CDI6_MANSE|nr:hypothetical protein O3G_MSEX002222 [Manduca sexta]
MSRKGPDRARLTKVRRRRTDANTIEVIIESYIFAGTRWRSISHSPTNLPTSKMFKLLIFAALLAFAVAKPLVVSYSAPYAAYTAPVAAAYTAPVAYSAYSAYSPYYSAYTYAAPYSYYV